MLTKCIKLNTIKSIKVCLKICSFSCANYNTQQLQSSYDVIIIGGGHNGLVAASYLAKNKLKVCVLERRNVLGGATVTEEIIPGFKFSRASYLLSLLRPQILDDLQLHKHGLKLYTRNPSSYTPLNKSKWTAKYKSLVLGMDDQKNKIEISKFSKKDAKKFCLYEKELARLTDCIGPFLDVSPHTLQKLLNSDTSISEKIKMIVNSKDIRKMLIGASKIGPSLKFATDLMFCPATDVLDSWFESEPLKATLLTDACIGTLRSPSSVGSGYTLLHHMMGEISGIKSSWAYVKGGMGSLSAAIASSAVSHGVHIFTNKEVTEIVVNDKNEAKGVVTKDGYNINAPNILSNATAKVTFLDLLPATSSDETFLRKIRNIDYSSSSSKINIALKKIPNFEADPNTTTNDIMPHHRCTIHLNCNSTSDILNAHNEGIKGLLPTRPIIEMTIPSSVDPTLCPHESHVCHVFLQYTTYNLSNGQEWNEQTKSKLADLVFSSIEDYAPGFKDSIIDYELLTPVDLENIFGLTGGNIFHGDLSLNQLLFNRSISYNDICSPYTPINGLLLCGSGIHPGGGVSGAPGRLAALTLIDKLKNK